MGRLACRLASSGCDTGPVLAIGSVVMKLHDIPRAAAFWCAALDDEPRRPVAADDVTIDAVTE
jgi:hypothetical protein